MSKLKQGLAFLSFSIAAKTGFTEITLKPLYATTSIGYVQAGNNIKGQAVSAGAGYHMGEGHNIEVQLRFLMEEGDTSACFTGFKIPMPTGNAPGRVKMNTHVRLKEAPIFVNYCYRHPCAFNGLSFYGGIGGGLYTFKAKRTLNVQLYDTLGNKGGPGTKIHTTENLTHAKMIAQLFAGASLNLTEHLVLNIGGTLMATQKQSWGGHKVYKPGTDKNNSSDIIYTPKVKADAIRWIVEAGLMWKF